MPKAKTSTGFPVRIGMMSTFLGLGQTALAAALIARAYGAEFFFFRPGDIDLANETINGHFYQDMGWIRRTTAFPDVVLNDVFGGVPIQVWKALVPKCRITTPYLGGKLAVDRSMRASGAFDALLIPTTLLQTCEQLLEQLELHEKIVVKPAVGTGGSGVMLLARVQEGFRGNFDGRNWSFGEPALRELYSARLAGKDHLAQKYIPSITRQGQPFDIRVHVRRGRKAEWQPIGLWARIGSGKSVVSNMAAGGSFSEALPFLINQFGGRGRPIYDQLVRLALDFPTAFQALYPDRSIPVLGLDVGLDRDGRPWLFEVNSSPSAQYVEMKDAIPGIGYALYLAENRGWPDGATRDEEAGFGLTPGNLRLK